MKNVTKGYNFQTNETIYTFRLPVNEHYTVAIMFHRYDETEVRIDFPRGEIVKVYTTLNLDSVFEEKGYNILVLRNLK